MYQAIKTALEQAANPEKSLVLGRFFKTGQGEYGEGDVFIGVPMPAIRLICKQFVSQTQLNDLQILLTDSIHEVRMAAVLILVYQFEKADDADKKIIYDFYLANATKINNWDFVDSSARQIVGCYLFDKPRDILYQLAHSHSLWEQRIAIIATFHFIKQQQFDDTFNIAQILLNHHHDLIHKAVGWMLREVGKRNQAELEKFLQRHYQVMPRTMLRYAIEKFPEPLRQQYLVKPPRSKS
jgi:3-methyladenine DNA glycosylase AlkD